MRSALTISKRVWVPRDLLLQARALATSWAPLEVGGVLAGYKSGDDVVLTHLVGPGPDAVHTTETFLPDHVFHEEEIVRIYTQTGGTSIYLGDWHTHPGGLPKLSRMDRSTLGAIANDAAANCCEPIMMVLAGYGPDWRPAVFQYDIGRATRRERSMHLRLW